MRELSVRVKGAEARGKMYGLYRKTPEGEIEFDSLSLYVGPLRLNVLQSCR